MGFLGWLFGGKKNRFGVDELARRIDVDAGKLRGIRPSYRTFTIPRKGGGTRTIAAPDGRLKRVQRSILKGVLGALKAHPAATGFERGRSIVTNALAHAGCDVVLRVDLKDFFASTSASRVRGYFAAIGWDAEATDVLVRLTTHEDALPQGAPTSPRLSNLVNHKLDARLAGFARRCRATYTRYADDITLSFARFPYGDVAEILAAVRKIICEEGYQLSPRKRPSVRRRSQRQIVTGLVVNERVNLPRERRRWLRAVAHRLKTGREPTLSKEQLAGWMSLVSMVLSQGRRHR